MATFHPFPRLPAEIRVQIWETTAEPRIVEVRIRYKRVTTVPHQLYGPFLFSSAPVPAPLQTCREARDSGLYHQAFSNLAIQNGAPKDTEERYVWLNFDLDMVSIGDTDFRFFKSVAQMIKRLRFERDNSDEVWYRGESAELYIFVNVTEIHVVVSEDSDMRHWHGASQDHNWPCAIESVFVVDLKEGQMVKLLDLEDKYDRMLEAEYRELNPGGEMAFFCAHPVNPFQ